MRLSAIASLALSGAVLSTALESGAVQGGAAECVQEPNGESSMHRHCWDGGKRQGRWKVRLPGGEVREGSYVAGKKEGRWVIRLPDGGVQEGSYVAGEKQGHWVLRHADGTVEEGPVVDGLREGGWVARRPDGSRRTFEMDGGAPVAGSVRVEAQAQGRGEEEALTRGDRRRVQSALAAQGFAPGPADGVFGPRTSRAIKAWQASNGYAATGVLTGEQAVALHSAAAQRVASPPRHSASAQQAASPPLWRLFMSGPQSGNVDAIMEALRQGADPNVTDVSGNTSVHYALDYGYGVGVLRALVAHGGRCGTRNSFGTTPLHVAAAQDGMGAGVPEAVRFLAECSPSSLGVRDDQGNTPLHALYQGALAFPLHTLTGGAHEGVLKALLEAGADPNAKNEAGDTPMLVLLKGGLFFVFDHTEHLRLLLKHGADPGTRDAEGTPAVTVTILKRPDDEGVGKELVTELLKAGADPDQRDRRGNTPLLYVSKGEYDRDELEVLLAAGADPCIADRGGQLPWDHALKAELRHTGKVLADAGGKPDPETGECARDAEAGGAEKALGLGRAERRRIQTCLKSEGFDPGPADGVFGPGTRAAIRGWQAARDGNAPATGYLTRAHADALSGCETASGPGSACTGKERGEGEGCWMELANQPGCWRWNPYPQPGETVTWSGGCTDGKASGKGEEVWRFRKDGEWKTSGGRGELRGGKTHVGHWIGRFSSGEVWEGPYVDGKRHGLWVRRGSDGRDWSCWSGGERAEGVSPCVEAEELAMQASAGARVRSGPGEEYEELGRLAEGEKVKVTGGVGDAGAWRRVEAPEGALAFVQASKLEEAAGSSWNVGEVFRDCPDCPELVVVPSGSFEMGSERFRWAGPVHRVTIARPFAVGVYEVTRGEYGRFVSETGHASGDSCHVWQGSWTERPGKDWREPGFSLPSIARRYWHRQTDADPVVCVNWDDAKAYVRWLSRKTGKEYRLLSESEWEYVARAGTRTRYWWGDEIGRNRTNCYDTVCGDSYNYTAPVGSFSANAFGLHDVFGNVSEWVEDCGNDSYHGAPMDGSAWESGDCGARVCRGASWRGFYIEQLYGRFVTPAGDRYSSTGFRVAKTLD